MTLPSKLSGEALPPTDAAVLREKICSEYAASIVDFFIDGTIVSREVLQVSIHDLIYGPGPETLMKDYYSSRVKQKLSFRWIHLHANNASVHFCSICRAMLITTKIVRMDQGMLNRAAD